MRRILRVFDKLLDDPVEGGLEGLTEHRATGFADVRQAAERPFHRRVGPELMYGKTIREHNEVHVPGLADAVSQLAVALSQFPFALPMERLRAYPSMSVDLNASAYRMIRP